MNYYLDTEFHEFKKKPLIGKAIDTIDLISIGIVSDDDREYYAISNEFDVKAAWNDEWLRDNVLLPIYLELIPDADIIKAGEFNIKSIKELIKLHGKSRKEIANDITTFTTGSPKFYAYYADYDWVVFCWLFGKMMDLPDTFPMYCNDLKQVLESKAMPSKDIISHTLYPINNKAHNALEDAKWNRELHRFLNRIK